MTIAQDLRHSFRTLFKTPGFSLIAIATLTLGVGANTAIFSVVNGTLLRPLAFREPGRLVAISEESHAIRATGLYLVNAMHFLAWRKEAHSFASLSLISIISRNFTGNGEPERLIGTRVSANLFAMLGVQPQLGRTFREQEDRAGANHVVILSYALWTRRFHADASILGRSIRLDGEPYQVIGVMPANLPQAGVSGVEWRRAGSEFWIPFGLRNDELVPYGDLDYECIGRLKQGVSIRQAQAELNAIQARIAATIPEKVDLGAQLSPLQDEITHRWQSALLLLFGAVGIVLLIGCVNIANLLLARAAGRSREFSIRVAVGASWRHLLAQSLTESFVLAALGGALGLMLASASFGFLIAHAPSDLPRLDEAAIDTRVFVFALAITIATGLLCGLLPALRYAHADPQEGLKTGSPMASENRQGQTIRSVLVSIEVALSTVCLVALGLLLHSFIQLMRVNRGFDVERVLTVNLSLPDQQYGQLAQRTQFWKRLLPKIEALPGVISAGISNRLPLASSGSDNMLIPEGQKLPISEQPVADMRFVNPEFFRTLGIPLASGRIFSQLDQDHRVAVISVKTAGRLFGNVDPIGKRFHLGDPESPLISVVGIVGDVRANGLQRAPKFTIYLPYWQRDRLEMASGAVRNGSAEYRGGCAAADSKYRCRTPRSAVPHHG